MRSRWIDWRIDAAVGDELIHALLEHGQRHGTERQDRIVEASLIELRPQLLFRLAAVTTDLELAELVGKRLTRPGDVAIDLRRDLVLRECRVRAQIVHRLFARPAELVDARVDDESTGAPHFVGEPAEVLV